MYAIIYRPSVGYLWLIEKPSWFITAGTITLAQLCFALIPIYFNRMYIPLEVRNYGIPLLIISRNIIDWCYSAVFILLCSILVSKNGITPSYNLIFIMVVYSNVIIALAESTSLLLGLLLWLQGKIENIRPIQIVNLDTILATHSLPGYIQYIAHEITIFKIWYLGVLSIGISSVIQCSRITALIIGFMLWFLHVGINSTFEDLLRSYIKGIIL